MPYPRLLPALRLALSSFGVLVTLAFAAPALGGCTAPVTMGKECGGAACGGGSLIGVDLPNEPAPAEDDDDAAPGPGSAGASNDDLHRAELVRFEADARSR